MLRALPILPFVAMIGLFACGSGRDPVDDAARATGEVPGGDASATGLAAPANSGAAEMAEQAAIPHADDGMRWALDGASARAAYGPAGASATMAVECRSGTLIVERWGAGAGSGAGTLSFTGNGQASSLPARQVAGSTATDGRWAAATSNRDHARAVAKTFAGPAAVQVSVGELPPLSVRPAPEVRRVLGACA
jgi:hypothetical protein